MAILMVLDDIPTASVVLKCTSAYNSPMAVMTVSEARAALPEVLNRVADGEEITITRHGRPVAVIVRPDILWSRSHASDLLEQAERLNEMLRAAAGSPRSPGGISVEYAEELVAAIRADRDAE
jgi:PHD/YefM family antitoxin component YafN of YafNO toxin-antitoxin module